MENIIINIEDSETTEDIEENKLNNDEKLNDKQNNNCNINDNQNNNKKNDKYRLFIKTNIDETKIDNINNINNTDETKMDNINNTDETKIDCNNKNIYKNIDYMTNIKLKNLHILLVHNLITLEKYNYTKDKLLKNIQ